MANAHLSQNPHTQYESLTGPIRYPTPMKAGVVGVVDGTFRKVNSTSRTVEQDGRELQQVLEIARVFSLPSGEMAFAGRAAVEEIRTEEEATIENGEISVTEQSEPVTRATEFVGVSGEFVVVDSGSGTFAFDLIASETETEATIERATLDLDAYYEAHGAATPWKAGFYGTSEKGINGIFHGDDLRTDHDIDVILQNSRLNQVGLSYAFEGNELKMTAARSGYVEVYQPTDFESGAYLEYLREELIPHAA